VDGISPRRHAQEVYSESKIGGKALPVSKFPIPVDLQSLLERLAREDQRLMHRLAELEDRIRKFEDFERPSYDEWIRLELGPQLMTLEELHQRIYERRILAQRVNDLIEGEGMHPREALYIALGKGADPRTEKKTKSKSEGAWDEDEIEARRRAKIEAKRAARRQDKKEQKEIKKEGRLAPLKGGLVSLYRALARRLHPDSAHLVQGLPAYRVLSLWMEVQTAYDSGNSERLLAITAWLSENTNEDLSSESPSSSFSERYEKIRSMKKSISRLEEKVSQLGTHPAWKFGDVRSSARRKIRQRAARELEDELARTQEVMDLLDDFIESIGPPRPPKKR